MTMKGAAPGKTTNLTSVYRQTRSNGCVRSRYDRIQSVFATREHYGGIFYIISSNTVYCIVCVCKQRELRT